MKGLRLVLAALLLLTQTACALHPRTELLRAGGYPDLNERAAHQEARLLMRDGAEARTRGLVLKDGTASWTDATSGAAKSTPVTEIAEVRLRNRSGRGAAIGGTWGFLLGAAAGIIVGLAQGDDPEGSCGDPFGCSSAGDYALVGAVVFGGIGWLVGLPVGAIKGVDDVYRLPAPPPGAPDRLLEVGSSNPLGGGR